MCDNRVSYRVCEHVVNDFKRKEWFDGMYTPLRWKQRPKVQRPDCSTVTCSLVAIVYYWLAVLLYRCSSHIGRKGGPQEVSIADGCSKVGHALHVLGHAIGLWHERCDKVHRKNSTLRTDYISFMRQNEIPDVACDIQSIMHNPFVTVTPSNKTITNQDTNQCLSTLEMGLREQLSYKDKNRTNALYGCDCKL